MSSITTGRAQSDLAQRTLRALSPRNIGAV